MSVNVFLKLRTVLLSDSPKSPKILIAIVGSRHFPDLDLVRAHVQSLPSNAVIVSGGASGVDTVAVEEAKLLGLGTIVYKADWKAFGRRAGAIRNQLIVDSATSIVAFWDNESKGTKITIDMATKANKPIQIILPLKYHGS